MTKILDTYKDFKNKMSINDTIEHECAEKAIYDFMDKNFAYGKYTFKEIKWTRKHTVIVTDKNNKKARIKYDIKKDTVELYFSSSPNATKHTF